MYTSFDSEITVYFSHTKDCEVSSAPSGHSLDDCTEAEGGDEEAEESHTVLRELSGNTC